MKVTIWNVTLRQHNTPDMGCPDSIPVDGDIL